MVQTLVMPFVRAQMGRSAGFRKYVSSMTEAADDHVVGCPLRVGRPFPSGSVSKEIQVSISKTTGGYVLANRVDRATADALRKQYDGAVVSRNADGTYRVTRAR
jgi:hypothetical protein